MVAGGEGSTDQEGREDSHQEGTKSVVVGIGASAGGIRALQEFFHAVPHRLGATFVVGPGNVVRYEHLDELTSDHAPVDEVLGALAG